MKTIFRSLFLAAATLALGCGVPETDDQNVADTEEALVSGGHCEVRYRTQMWYTYTGNCIAPPSGGVCAQATSASCPVGVRVNSAKAMSCSDGLHQVSTTPCQ